MKLLENDVFVIERDDKDFTKITLSSKTLGCVLCSATVDPHDNRTVITAESAPLKALFDGPGIILSFSEYLSGNFGGKQFVCLPADLSPELKDSFAKTGFVVSDAKCARARVTTPERMLAGIQAKFGDMPLPDGFTCSTETRQQDMANIKDLMINSGFLPEKVADYLAKGGGHGMEISRDISSILMIRNKEGEIVALVRCTNNGHGIGYICDTLVNNKAGVFPGANPEEVRAFGTALIYKMGLTTAWQGQGLQQILLIDPPNRENEFDTNFGCQKLGDATTTLPVLCRFGAPQPMLVETFSLLGQKYEAKQEQQGQVAAAAASFTLPSQ